MNKSPSWTRIDWIILLSVTALAIALRLFKLGEVPPGFQFDEAFNAIDAQQVLEGNRPLFLPANAGREVIYTYLQAAVVTIYGFFTGSGTPVTPYTLRLTSAIGGITLIPLIYTILRRGLRKNARLIASGVAVAQAVSMWHIHFSHFGIRVVWMPVMFSLAFGLYWLASTRHTQRSQLIFYGLAGIATGLTVWNHPTGRFAPFVLILYTGWIWLTATSGQQPLDTSNARSAQSDNSQSQERKQALIGLVVTGIVAFIVFIPLGLVFLDRPDFFFSHAADSSFLNEEVSDGSPLRTLLFNFVKVLGMFSISGDQDWTHNLPGRPVFDPLMSIAFLIGVFLWQKRLRDPKDPDRNLLAMMMIWLIVMLFPSILSNDAPDYSRTMPSHPALMIAPGLGLGWLWLSTQRFTWRWVGPFMVGLIVAISGGWAYYDYFVDFPTRAELYYAYDVDKLDTLNRLAEFTDGNSVYLSRLWANHATPTFLRGQTGIQSIETSETLVLPPLGNGAVYAFPHEQVERSDDLMEIFPTASLTDFDDPQGEALLHIVEVPAGDLATWPAGYEPTFETEIHFDDAPTLLGMQPDEQDGSLLLFWRAEKMMLRDLTSFVHLLDDQGTRVAQVDRNPGGGTYRTPDWRPGERVIDRYWPEIDDPCVSGLSVRAVVGWYQLADEGRRRERADGAGDIALAGRLTLPTRAYPAEQLNPGNEISDELNNGLTLVGYSLPENHLEAGSLLPLTLYWEGMAATPLTLQLSNQTSQVPIWEGILDQADDWEPGERICRRFNLRIPLETEAGEYRLQAIAGDANAEEGEDVDTPSQAIDLTTLSITMSSRTFEAPSGITSVDAQFTDELEENAISLVGFQIEDTSSTQDEISPEDLELTLVWRADSTIENRYSVFVHVLDASGQIVAQSDAVPGNSPTNLWVIDEVILDTHSISDVPNDDMQILVGLYDSLTTRRLIAKDMNGNLIANGAIELPTE